MEDLNENKYEETNIVLHKVSWKWNVLVFFSSFIEATQLGFDHTKLLDMITHAATAIFYRGVEMPRDPHAPPWYERIYLPDELFYITERLNRARAVFLFFVIIEKLTGSKLFNPFKTNSLLTGDVLDFANHIYNSQYMRELIANYEHLKDRIPDQTNYKIALTLTLYVAIFGYSDHLGWSISLSLADNFLRFQAKNSGKDHPKPRYEKFVSTHTLRIAVDVLNLISSGINLNTFFKSESFGTQFTSLVGTGLGLFNSRLSAKIASDIYQRGKEHVSSMTKYLFG